MIIFTTVTRYIDMVGWFGLFLLLPNHLEHRASVKRFVSLQFFNLRYSLGLLEPVISPSHGRYLTQAQNENRKTSMLRVGFEPTIPAFEGATVIGTLI
jgi:hypothetical protein